MWRKFDWSVGGCIFFLMNLLLGNWFSIIILQGEGGGGKCFASSEGSHSDAPPLTVTTVGKVLISLLLCIT